MSGVGQSELFPSGLRAQYDDGTYPDGFWDWLDDNWHVYEGFVELARTGIRKGLKRWGAFGVVNVLRWQTAIRERGNSDLKINNNASPGLARLAMAMYPDEFTDFFETRTPSARRDAVRLDGTRYTE